MYYLFSTFLFFHKYFPVTVDTEQKKQSNNYDAIIVHFGPRPISIGHNWAWVPNHSGANLFLGSNVLDPCQFSLRTEIWQWNFAQIDLVIFVI